MEKDFNPYAAPQASLQTPVNYETDDCWRQGKTLFLRAGRPLPCRCIRCNEPALTPIKARKIYWHPPGWYLLIFLGFGILIYALIAMAVRRKATIYPGLCARHTDRRRNTIGVAWLSFFGAIALFFVAGANKMPMAAAGGSVLILVAIVTGLVGSRLLYPTRIDDRIIQLKGAGAPFLDSLPRM